MGVGDWAGRPGLLDPEPDGFEVCGFFAGDGEVGWLGAVMFVEDAAAGAGDSSAEAIEEFAGRQARGIGRREEGTWGGQEREGGGDETFVVTFSAKDAVGFRA